MVEANCPSLGHIEARAVSASGTVMSLKLSEARPGRRHAGLLSVPRPSARTTRMAARSAASLLVVAGGFQLALAAGAPWGHAAWGGQQVVLPRELRLASVGSAAFLFAGAFLISARGGLWKTNLVPTVVLHWCAWLLTAATALSAVGNLASSSNWERFLNGPLVGLLAILCTVVCLKGSVNNPDPDTESAHQRLAAGRPSRLRSARRRYAPSSVDSGCDNRR